MGSRGIGWENSPADFIPRSDSTMVFKSKQRMDDHSSLERNENKDEVRELKGFHGGVDLKTDYMKVEGAGII